MADTPATPVTPSPAATPAVWGNKALYIHVATLWLLVGVIAGGFFGGLTVVGVLEHFNIHPAPAPGPGPTPGPYPTPVPVPPPKPTPVTGHLFAITVWDYDALGSLPVGQVDLRVSPTIVDATKSLDVEWRAYDQNNPAIAPWKPKAVEIGLPALLITDKKGNLIKGLKVPADEPATLKLLQELRGK